MTNCATTADCAEVTDGCCMQWTITAVAEGGDFAAFDAAFEGTDYYPVVGDVYGQCATAAYAEAVNGQNMSMAGSFQAFLDTASPEELEFLGIFPEDTLEDIVGFFGADMYSLENTTFDAWCEGMDKEMDFAVSLTAASTAILAVTLLN